MFTRTGLYKYKMNGKAQSQCLKCLDEKTKEAVNELRKP